MPFALRVSTASARVILSEAKRSRTAKQHRAKRRWNLGRTPLKMTRRGQHLPKKQQKEYGQFCSYSFFILSGGNKPPLCKGRLSLCSSMPCQFAGDHSCVVPAPFLFTEGIDVAVDAVFDDLHRDLTGADLVDGGGLVLQILVDREEVAHLLKDM